MSGFPAGLSGREVEVLKLVAGGLSNREIAATLTLSVRTVDRHISRLYDKLGIHSRASATVFALRNGLLD